MKTLIIYDNTGKIWAIMNADHIPEGFERFAFELPENAAVTSMDMSDPEHPVPVYTVPEAGGIDQLEEEITEMQIALANMYEMFIAAGGQG